MQQATFLAGFLACRSQMFFNWKRGEHLRTMGTEGQTRQLLKAASLVH